MQPLFFSVTSKIATCKANKARTRTDQAYTAQNHMIKHITVQIHTHSTYTPSQEALTTAQYMACKSFHSSI